MVQFSFLSNVLGSASGGRRLCGTRETTEHRQHALSLSLRFDLCPVNLKVQSWNESPSHYIEPKDPLREGKLAGAPWASVWINTKCVQTSKTKQFSSLFQFPLPPCLVNRCFPWCLWPRVACRDTGPQSNGSAPLWLSWRAPGVKSNFSKTWNLFCFFSATYLNKLFSSWL